METINEFIVYVLEGIFPISIAVFVIVAFISNKIEKKKIKEQEKSKVLEKAVFYNSLLEQTNAAFDFAHYRILEIFKDGFTNEDQKKYLNSLYSLTDARLQSTREIEFRDAHTHKLNMTTEEFLAAEYQMRLLNNEDQEIIYRMLVLNQIVKFVNGIPPALMFYGGVNEACKNHENYRIFFDKFTLAMNARTPMYK